MKIGDRRPKIEIPDDFWYPNPVDNSNKLHEDSVDIEVYNEVWELIKKLEKI